MGESACELCKQDGGEIIFRNTLLRVVIIDDEDYPGFCRVILNDHIKEMTDLPVSQRSELMAAVFAVEEAVREVMQADKINLASLGNMTPHMHWHIIPRYTKDKHFPRPIWAEPMRQNPSHQIKPWRVQLRAALLKHLTC